MIPSFSPIIPVYRTFITLRYGVKKGGETMEYVQLFIAWATTLVKIIISNPFLLGIILLKVLSKRLRTGT